MHHIQTQILGQMVHADTLYFAWACMAVILVFALFLVSGLKADPAQYGKRQFFAEGIFDFIRNLAKDQIGKRGDHYVFFVGTIFIFILVNYYAGLLPWKMGAIFSWWPQLPVHGHEAHAASHPWHGASPCADINVPAGMALIVVTVYFLSGILVGGMKYLGSFSPLLIKDSKGSFWNNLTALQIEIPFTGGKALFLNLMCLIEIMDLAVRPLTLSLRLFANTVAGEALLATFIALTVLIFPTFILGFEMAVGLLQAFLFTILTTVYIGSTVKHAEHLLHDHH